MGKECDANQTIDNHNLNISFKTNELIILAGLSVSHFTGPDGKKNLGFADVKK
jgi:hypothetical protein